MILNKYIFLTFIVLPTRAQNTCKTADDKDGECVPIKDCTSIMNILRSLPRPIPESTVLHLRKNLCRSENQTHFVCCESIQNHQMNSFTEHPNINIFRNLNCGVELQGDKIFIGHGNKTLFLEYPWMALLGYQTSGGLQFQCGGTLINSRYILTAAHCVKGISDTLVSVRLGEHDLSTETDCDEEIDATYCAPPVQNINVELLIPHPEYDNPRYANDIALIRLSQEAVFNDAVSPICLPLTEKLQQLNLREAIISGWGLTEKNITSGVLLKANIPVVPNRECERFYQRTGVKLSDKQLCAGGESYSDSCRGDSGGPLFFFPSFQETFKNTQFGIISAGGVHCGWGFPVIFTRVAAYLNWILDQIKE